MPGSKAAPDLRVAGAPTRSLVVPGAPKVAAAPVAGQRALAVAPAPLVRALAGPPGKGGLPHKPVRPSNAPGPKPKGGMWFPDEDIPQKRPIAATPEEDGWFVHDRGEHAAPGLRYMARRGDDTNTAYYTHTPERAWQHALSEHQYDQDFGMLTYVNNSPESAARMALAQGPPNLEEPVSDALQRALTKYYKTEFGTAHDPVRNAIVEGRHWDAEMTPEKWDEIVDSSIAEDPVGYYTVPRFGMPQGVIAYNDKLSEGLLTARPKLAVAPVTDPFYQMKDVPHLGPEFFEGVHALTDPTAGLPPSLRVGDINRLNFRQLVERVGDLNEYQANELLKSEAADPNHPALFPHKTYPGDERGMYWTKIGMPKLSDDLLSERDRQLIQHADENDLTITPEAREAAQKIGAEAKLRQALKYEGDPKRMNLCMRKDEYGYCEKVMSGESEIYSLRDKKGKSYVSIEASPGRSMWDTRRGQAIPEGDPLADVYNDYFFGGGRLPDENLDFPAHVRKNHPDLYDADIFEPRLPHIEQIKGFSNLRPEGRYNVQPYITDFVKSGDWNNVYDMPFTDLRTLPGGKPGGQGRRYISKDDFTKVLGGLPTDVEFGPGSRQYWTNPYAPHEGDDLTRPIDPDKRIVANEWPAVAPYFEGYAKGGAVRSPRRQFEVDPGLIERALIEEASAKYPFIRRHHPVLTEGSGEGGSETWLHGDEGAGDRPRPLSVGMDELGVQAYRPLGIDDFAGEVLHGDDRANAVRRDLRLSLTPEQWARLKHGSLDYGDDSSPESEERRRDNAVDGLIRGYTVGQWPGVADEIGLTENQRGPLDNLGVYMHRGY
jgi:hypothetical protein